MVRLFCAVVGDGRIFPVDVDIEKSVGALKKAVLEEIFDLTQFGAPALTLYLARRGDTWLNDDDDDMVAVRRGDIPDTIKPMMANHMKPLTELSADEYFGKNFTPGDRDIHVLVLLTNTKKRLIQEVDGFQANSTQPSSARTAYVSTHVADASSGWFEHFRVASYASSSLPPRTELSDFVASPLPVKMRLDGRTYEKVTAAIDPSIVDKMFVLDERASNDGLWEKIVFHTLNPLRGGGTTAKAFIGFWDSFIHRPLHVLFERGAVHRFDPWTGAQRPDMVLRVDQICVFRGQEADPHLELRVPSQALRDKVVWIFGDKVPYILGYAASGFQCALYAMYYSSGAHKVEITQIGVYKTDAATHRFKFVLALLQLTRLFRGIVELCPASAKREFDDLVRSNGVVVRLNPTHVVKDFANFKANNKFAIDSRALVNIYEKLQELAVPYTDRLDHVSSSGNELTFKPRGLEMKPRSLEELFVALECALTALDVLHKAGWMHRDISWANLMKYRGPTPAWFLIDFAEAAQSPQAFPSGSHLTRHDHAPEMFVEGGEHTTAVDIWSVGRLIDEWDGQMVWQFSPARNRFMVNLLHSDPTKRPTAAEALKELEQLKKASLKDLVQHAQGVE